MSDKMISVLEWNDKLIRYLKGYIDSGIAHITAFETVPIDRSESIPGLIGGLSQRHDIKASALVIVVPKYKVFARRVTLPPCEENEIDGMAVFEAEKYLPFPVEEAVLDLGLSSKISNTSPNEVMLYAAKKEIVNEYLGILKSAGLFPENIVVKPAAVAALAGYLGRFEKGAFCFIGIDETAWETDFFIDGNIVLSRGMGAADDGTQSGITSTKEEILKSLSSFKSTYRSSEINSIVISAGDNNRLAFNIHDIVGQKTEKIDFDEAKIEFSAVEYKTGLTTASAMAGALFLSGKRPNLLPAEARAEFDSKTFNKNILKISFLALLSIFLISGFLFYKNMKSYSKNREISKLLKNSGKEMIELEKKERILKLVGRYSKDSALPLEILNELSEIVPANVYITNLQYDYAQGTVDLKCRTNSFDTASKTTGLLARSKVFSGITSRGARAVKFEENNLVDFEIECRLRNNSESAENDSK